MNTIRKLFTKLWSKVGPDQSPETFGDHAIAGVSGLLEMERGRLSKGWNTEPDRSTEPTTQT
jgi:hypothetical protein